MPSALSRLVGQLLRPIADVVIILLQPLLQMWKPIIKMFNELIRPYRRMAMSIMSQNKAAPGSSDWLKNIAASTGVMLTGFAVAIMAVVKEAMKISLTLFATLAKTFINPIIATLIDAILPGDWYSAILTKLNGLTDSGVISAGDALDSAFEIAKKSIDDVVNKLGESFGLSMENLDLSKASNLLKSKIEEMVESAARSATKDKKRESALLQNNRNPGYQGENFGQIRSYDSLETAMLKGNIALEQQMRKKALAAKYSNTSIGGL